MDVSRSPSKRKLTIRLAAVGAAVAIALVTFGLSRMRAAVPTVDRNTLVIDTVRRGPMVREIRGSGVLTPEEVRLIAIPTDGRVERIVVQPGSTVDAGTVVLELSNDQQQQAARDSEWQLRAAEADHESMRAQLDSERLDREASVAHVEADSKQARLRAAADAELERQGLTAHITSEMSKTSADELARRADIEQERLSVSRRAQESRLAATRAQVEQRRAMNELQQARVNALHVRAGIAGVLQQIDVQAGQRVTAGTTVARVARPDRLKAQVRVAETQAKDIVVGLRASVDTRNGVVAAHVARIDPAVREGTVTVDLTIDGALPSGARPDLSVDATIELDRIADAIYVARPPSAQESAPGTLFKVNGERAESVKVVFGRASASAIEIRSGLAPGDQVIVSDSSAWDRSDHIRIQ
ncbi:MAG TPA: HlyD family efflux transporter periplasmic adaptor subunit [Thermoanaerobaculia bacterium]|nr:HlyD family efflux transporter periplasmic adaptor subunit [Thermoanaerobaculia bacterium]